MTKTPRYGKSEFLYAQPFADALVGDPGFREWVIGRTRFADRARHVRLLHEQMFALRSRGTQYWWRSYYYKGCTCFGCREKETDLLAIFEDVSGFRFALHLEVKHPKDRFKKEGEQAAAYPVRADCWARRAPPNVLPHQAATTGLLCSQSKLGMYQRHLVHFHSIFTFEEIKQNFPNAAAQEKS